jgi:hypothetical protein
MGPEQLIEYETRVRPRQSAIAGGAALLLLLAPIVGLAGVHAKVDELTLDLIKIHSRFPLDLIAAVIQAIGLLALADTLGWLESRSRARNPQLKSWITWLGVAGATMFAVGVAGGELAVSLAADKFVSSGTQTYLQAYSLTTGGVLAVLPIIEQVGALMLAAGYVLIALNGMRVGLLPRYLGFIGVAAGALVVFPVVPVPVVACFWLGALAMLLYGRWPSGMPPAWTSGTAVPWEPQTPRGAAASRSAQPAATPRAARRRQPPPAAPQPMRPQIPDRTRSNTPKRKRKHR